jgi:trimeric autotransporter adhesin
LHDNFLIGCRERICALPPLIYQMLRFALAALLLGAVAQGQAWYQMRTLAGAGGIGDGGPATAALFLKLNGIAVDPTGNLYVADTDAHRVRKISPAGIVTTFAGTGKPGFSGDGGPAAQARLNYPYGVATDYAGTVYVADLANARIRRIAPDGRITTVAGDTPESKLIAPRNVAVDGPGQVYVSDFDGHRVYKVTPKGLVTIAGSGKPGKTGDGGPAATSFLNSPAGLAFDPAGNLYIGDTGNKKVRMVNLAGTISSVPETQLLPVVATGLAHTFAGDLWVPDGNGGTLMRVAPQQPGAPFSFAAMDVAADFAGNVYSVWGNRVRKTAARAFTTSAVAGGTPYYFAGDGGSAFEARLHHPAGITVDPSTGTVYIADTGNGRIRRIWPGSGNIETVLDGFAGPRGLYWDRKQGALYIADPASHSVWVWRSGSIAQTLLAGGTGTAGFKGDAGPAIDAQLSSPAAVTVDDKGNIWIADTGNDRVRRIDALTGTIRTVAQIKGVAGIIWDSRGFVYASEPAAGKIHTVDEKGLLESIARPGIWTAPQALALDFEGSLLVLDTATHRLSRMVSDGSVTVLAGTGEGGFDGDAPAPAVSSRLDAPGAMVADYSNLRLLIADTNNGRIRSLDYPDSTAGGIVSGPSVPTTVTLSNAASKAPLTGGVAAGSLVLLSGNSAALTDDAEVAFDGVVAPRLNNGADPWLVQVPEYLPPGATETELTISRGGVVQVRQFVAIAKATPGVYPNLVHAEDGSVNSSGNPILRGSVLILRMTGEGRADLPIEVQIRGMTAPILNQIQTSGILQLEVQVPGGYFGAGAFPLTVSVGGVASQAGLQVFVR